MGALLFVIVVFIICVGGGYALGNLGGEIITYFFKDKGNK